MAVKRPLDALNEAKGKRVIVELKNDNKIVGELLAFDIHLNLVLKDGEERSDSERVKLGQVLVRGDSIRLISPE